MCITEVYLYRKIHFVTWKLYLNLTQIYWNLRWKFQGVKISQFLKFMPKVVATRIQTLNNSPLLPDLGRERLVVQTEAVRRNKEHSVIELKTSTNGITIYFHSLSSHFTQLLFYYLCPALLWRMQRTSIVQIKN